MTSKENVIVVGYDGSPAALAAVEAAIDRLDDGRMVVVHAYHVPADFYGASYYQEMLDETLAQARSVVDELQRSCPRLADVEWEPDLVAGPAGDAICRVAEAREASEIFIGTRGHGHLRAALGSVALDVLHRARCPVLVVPKRAVPAPIEPRSASAV